MRFLRALAAPLAAGFALALTIEPAAAQPVRDPNPCLDPVARAGLLCPRLTINRPAGMYYERAGGRLLLRATSSLNNVGEGPIELHGLRTGPNTMSATQRIYRRSGGFVTVRTGARLGFKSIPGQYRYWKLRDAARFQLFSADRRGRPLRLVRTGPKLYYCVRDLRHTHPGPLSPHSPRYPGCSQRSDVSRVTLGTSVGWSDVYPATYYEQWIDVTGLHGRFLYVLTADPAGAIYTTNATPPQASRLVTIP